MNNQSYNKEELQKEIDAKVRASFQGDDDLEQLVVFTLENFAYRYLETKNLKNLKPFNKDLMTWRVESCESELIEALKANNPDTKKVLIEQAKNHAKKDGASVTNWIEVQLIDNKAKCFAGVVWKSEGHPQVVAKKESVLEYDDVVELRNKLAKILEQVCEVF